MNQNVQQRRSHVDKAKRLSIVCQCELLCIHHSGFYYKPEQESTINLELMRQIVEKHLLHL